MGTMVRVRASRMAKDDIGREAVMAVTISWTGDLITPGPAWKAFKFDKKNARRHNKIRD
jgi:hypothetical protein